MSIGVAGPHGWFWDPHVTIDGNDWSSEVRRVRLLQNRQPIDLNAGGDQMFRRVLGRGDISLEVELWQSFYNAEIDEKLQAIYVAGNEVTVTIRPSATAALSTDNPQYSGSYLLTAYSPMDASVDDAIAVTVTFTYAAGGLFSTIRATA